MESELAIQFVYGRQTDYGGQSVYPFRKFLRFYNNRSRKAH
jgi:hypothetical protein